MKKYIYDDYIRILTKRIQSQLDEIEAEYGYDYGPEFEIAICEFLRRLLPTKFGITRGFAVSQNGDKAGDDIIIYDQNRFPSLWLRNKNDFSKKENIPIEAIYCYIEAKHTVHLWGKDEGSLIGAIKQVDAVKNLCATRDKLPLNPRKRELGYPNIANPVYGAVISRRVKLKKNDKKYATPDEISINMQQVPKIPILTDGVVDNIPDVVVLGAKNIMLPVIMDKPDEATLVPFFLIA